MCSPASTISLALAARARSANFGITAQHLGRVRAGAGVAAAGVRAGGLSRAATFLLTRTAELPPTVVKREAAEPVAKELVRLQLQHRCGMHGFPRSGGKETAGKAKEKAEAKAKADGIKGGRVGAKLRNASAAQKFLLIVSWINVEILSSRTAPQAPRPYLLSYPYVYIYYDEATSYVRDVHTPLAGCMTLPVGVPWH
jgi:hypothetical protein